MIEIFFQNPLLFFLLVLNILICSYIGFVLFLTYTRKKRLKEKISYYFEKMKFKKKAEEIENIEDCYYSVMNLLKKRKIVLSDKWGFLAREDALERAGKLRPLLEKLFRLYELKVYAKRKIKNETQIAREIFRTFLRY